MITVALKDCSCINKTMFALQTFWDHKKPRYLNHLRDAKSNLPSLLYTVDKLLIRDSKFSKHVKIHNENTSPCIIFLRLFILKNECEYF